MNDLRPLLLTLALISSPALADAPALTERDAVANLAQHNPTLQAAVLDVRQSAEAVRAQNARYLPTLLLDATGTTQATPSLNLTTGTTRSTSQALVFGAELTHTFSWGTVVDLRLENTDSQSQGPAFSGTSDLITLGPGYALRARLSVTQPLWRGFGDEVGLADLRAALLNRKESERARDGVAGDALSTLLQAYWELWYSQRALDIQRDARALAAEQLEGSRKKVLAGSAAELDSLSYETQVASLEQSVLGAEITVRQRAIDLNRAMGRRQSEEGLDVSASTPMAIEATDAAQAVAAAQAASYSVAQQAIALELVENSLRSAADATRPRLDVQAWVQTQGLGNQTFAAAAAQLDTFANVSANVGLVLELPLSSARHEAQLAQARLAVSAAAARLEAAKQQVAADTSSELATLEQARTNVALAQRSADVSSRSAEAQRKRYLNGSALAIEVQQAEDSLRQARLSVERERVNAVKAQIRLSNLTGNLLPEWGLQAGR